MTNGDIVQMKSTWGAEGETLALDVDPTVHPGLDRRRHAADGYRRARVQVQKKYEGLGF